MKKVLTLVALLGFASFANFVCGTAFAQQKDDQEFIVKLGFQPQGIATMGGTNYNTNVGMAMGIEYFQYFGNIVAAGGGALYEFPRNFKDNLKGDISFLPIYVGLKMRTPLHGLDNNYAFLAGRLGYSAFMNSNPDWIKSSSGGMYYSAGLGVCISYLLLEAVYAVNNFSFTTPADKNYDERYSTITLYAGFKFE